MLTLEGCVRIKGNGREEGLSEWASARSLRGDAWTLLAFTGDEEANTGPREASGSRAFHLKGHRSLSSD